MKSAFYSILSVVAIGLLPIFSLHARNTCREKVNETYSIPTPKGNGAKITLKMNDVWGGNYGYQILLFNDTTAFGKWFSHGRTFPENTFPEEGFTPEEVYAMASHRLPQDAKPDINSQTAVYNNQTVSVSVPEGVYDMVIVNLTENFGDPVFMIPESPDGYQDNIHLVDGAEYVFEISYVPGSTPRGDMVVFKAPFDLSITETVLPESSTELGSSHPVSVKVTNLGTQAAKGFTLTYSINGKSVSKEEINTNLEAGQTSEYTFSTEADFSQSGQLYTVESEVIFEKDAQPRNNRSTAYIKKHGSLHAEFKDNFNREPAIPLNWTIVDANQDGTGWSFCNEKDFGNNPAGGCMKASFHETNKGDDYLITQDPIYLTEGRAHISFYCASQSKYIPEEMEILIGTSDKVGELTSVGKLIVENNLFEFHSVETEIKTAGNYYVAFRFISDKNQLYLYLDEVSIGSGSFSRTPDLVARHIQLPILPCMYDTETEVGAILENIGNQDIYGFDLVLSEQDGRILATESFPDTILSGETIEISFNTRFDLSDLQPRNLILKGILTEKNNPESDTTNNKISTHTLPGESITFYPYLSIFQEHPWRSLHDQGWKLENNIYQATESDIPLFTPCFSLETGQRYRFQMTFTAGMVVSGYDFSDNFLVLIGQKDKDYSQWDTLIYAKDIVELEPSTLEAYLEVDESGEYGIAIISTFFYHLDLHQIRLEKVGAVDVRLNHAQWLAASTLPQAQMTENTRIPIGIQLENRGIQDCQVKISVMDEKKQLQEIGSVSLGKGITKDTTLEYQVAEDLSIGTHSWNVVIETDGDTSPEDNTDTLSFEISKDFYAWESMSDFNNTSNIIGSSIPAVFGTIYEIYQTDTLTAIRLGLGATTEQMEIGICLYKMKNNMSLGNPIFNLKVERGKESGLKDFHFAPVILEPGRYFIGAQQLGESPINIGADMSKDGKILIMESDFLYEQDDLGYPCIRAVFSPQATMKPHDIAAVKLLSPTSDSAFYSHEERITALFLNNGSDTAKDVKVVFQINKEEKQMTTIAEIAPYAQAEVSFVADMSQPIEYFVRIYSEYDADSDHGNDTLENIFLGRTDISDPYTMDFEYCNDFSQDGFRPKWKSVDMDGSFPGAYLEGISFPGNTAAAGFMAFNPFHTEPSVNAALSPYQGEKYGVSFYAGNQPNNDWLISPKLTMAKENPSIRFAVKAVSNDVTSYTEVFNVLVSEKSDKPDDFVPVRMNMSVKGGDWQKMEVGLDEYAGKDVHVAIQCISYNQFMFMIDDIRISKPGETSTENMEIADAISVYPIPANEHIFVESHGTTILRYTLYDIRGTEIIKGSSGGSMLTLEVNHLTPGMYLLKIETDQGNVYRKIVVR